jgi:hypothetical protein
MLEYAAACGVYFGSPVEAPVTPENRVRADVARAPDTAVISTSCIARSSFGGGEVDAMKRSNSWRITARS